MTRSMWGVLFCLCFAFVAICFGYVKISDIVYAGRTASNNPCVLVHPRHSISGYIEFYGNAFYDDSTGFQVKYKGTRKMSGQECVVTEHFTRLQYERAVYGGKMCRCPNEW